MIAYQLGESLEYLALLGSPHLTLGRGIGDDDLIGGHLDLPMVLDWGWKLSTKEPADSINKPIINHGITKMATRAWWVLDTTG